MCAVAILDAEYESVAAAVEEIFSRFPAPTSEVLIKPNLLGGFSPDNHVTTHPSLIRALVNYFTSRDLQIKVGDNPAGSENILEKARKAGLFQAADGHFIPLSQGKDVSVESFYFSTLVVSQEVLSTPFLLNVPKFKTHLQTIITGAIKNMFGILPGEEKSMIHATARSLKDFSRALVDIYSIRPPNLSIMDAIVGMEGNGPSSGHLRHIGKLIVSDNGVELDAVMAHMMGLEPHKIPMLSYAHEKGLGEISTDSIDIQGILTRIPGFRVPSKSLVSFITPMSSRYYDLLAVKPSLNKKRCTRCWECIEKCPVAALSRQEYPVIDRDACVSCFCCVEVCENHAMQVPSRARDLFNRVLLKS
ncbi:MAG: DUF362 domain-containing protein [Theionarchaea archaeon]|nr:DUF362 domain-containing protein [Theionarchaea archaeon]